MKTNEYLWRSHDDWVRYAPHPVKQAFRIERDEDYLKRIMLQEKQRPPASYRSALSSYLRLGNRSAMIWSQQSSSTVHPCGDKMEHEETCVLDHYITEIPRDLRSLARDAWKELSNNPFIPIFEQDEIARLICSPNFQSYLESERKLRGQVSAEVGVC